MPGEKILVCDDEEKNLLLCVQILEEEGYEVEGVNNGYGAIEMARKKHFDLLLVDFVMPGINGLETFKIIKEFDPEVVGTIVTSYGTFATAIDALKLGFQGFITKPFTYEELLFAVSETLKKSKLEKELIAYRQADKLKDDFLALISHELRTPLSLILSFIRLISDARAEKADKKEKEILFALEKEGNRLARIVSNLLLMSELKFQKDEYLREWVGLNSITVNMIKYLKGDALDKKVTINNFISEGLPNVFGVKTQIKQLVVNLLDNAIKFNRQYGKITVRAEKKGSSVQFEIEDTGTGIAEDKLDKIFNPFQQVEDPVTRKVGGAGLGLAISREIVKVHGGKIWAENLDGGGSRFIFNLPISSNENIKDIPKKN